MKQRDVQIITGCGFQEQDAGSSILIGDGSGKAEQFVIRRIIAPNQAEIGRPRWRDRLRWQCRKIISTLSAKFRNIHQ